MNDLVQMVKEWHEQAFTDRHPLKTAKKVLEEASELHCLVKDHSKMDRGPGLWHAGKAFRDEIGDVLITIMALGTFYDIDLEAVMVERFLEIKERPNQQERDRERGIE